VLCLMVSECVGQRASMHDCQFAVCPGQARAERTTLLLPTGELCPSPGHLRPGQLSAIQEGDRPLHNLAVDNSLTGGGFADHHGGGGDQSLDPRHAHKIGRIRIRDECAMGLNVGSNAVCSLASKLRT
jgi:hypothetical protein